MLAIASSYPSVGTKSVVFSGKKARGVYMFLNTCLQKNKNVRSFRMFFGHMHKTNTRGCTAVTHAGGTVTMAPPTPASNGRGTSCGARHIGIAVVDNAVEVGHTTRAILNAVYKVSSIAVVYKAVAIGYAKLFLGQYMLCTRAV
jgi:hypothetical protein